MKDRKEAVMTALQMWSLIIGALAPIVIAWVQQPKWAEWLRAVVTVVFCLIVGSVNVWLNGDFAKASDWVAAVGLIFMAAITAYKGFWKPTGIAPKMEAATSPGQGTHDNPTAP
jgi:peptidoglycan/LPS O-acetylase OafA/YrhL